MKKKESSATPPETPEAPTPAPQADGQPEATDGAPSAPGGAVFEPPAEGVMRLEGQVGEWKAQAADWKDRALRTAADFDNFRKRSYKEREDAATRAQGEVLSRMIDVVDDLARVAHLDPAQSTAQALHDGMLAIERKFYSKLESAGVERIDPAGQPFDPNSHEAVTTMPAPSEDADGTVGAVFQHGYRFRGTLLRPARVAVLKWSPAAG